MSNSLGRRLADLVGSPMKEIQEEFISVVSMQNQIMPDPHLVKIFGDFDIYGRTIPMAIVGGDFYDFIGMESFGLPGRLALIIADASGHGLAAAMLIRDFNTAMFTALEFQTQYESDTSPLLLEKINRRLHRTSLANQFISAFYGELTLAGRLRYINAGHLPPLLVRPDGYEILDCGGPVLGAFRDLPVPYQVGEVRMHPGDILVGFTDGITEAFDTETREEFGEERLLQTIQEHRSAGSRRLFRRIIEAVDEFAPVQSDDQTLVIISLPSG